MIAALWMQPPRGRREARLSVCHATIAARPRLTFRSCSSVQGIGALSASGWTKLREQNTFIERRGRFADTARFATDTLGSTGRGERSPRGCSASVTDGFALPRISHIVIRGAREHNLSQSRSQDSRAIALVVITGLSGSGKSTLAFDTIYAEGQRRYVESLSAYARQFLAQMSKPDVDSIEGLSPAIAIEQKMVSKQSALHGRHHRPRFPTTCASSSPVSDRPHCFQL